jgi:hypothetical protein
MSAPIVVADACRIEDVLAGAARLAPTDESFRYRHGDLEGVRKVEGRRIEPSQIDLDLTACDEAPLRFRRADGKWDWQARIAHAQWRQGRLIVAYELELC